MDLNDPANNPISLSESTTISISGPIAQVLTRRCSLSEHICSSDLNHSTRVHVVLSRDVRRDFWSVWLSALALHHKL